ncbi:hypothetical protein O0880_09735 [Janthinobacterium sp. SUN118]|uniref:hypothetical protein n=1 Tax=Janthinobacterium sp. SUN118 TaxID=3004100 RepID=UPI0025B2053F|nr:hypothetical protein [Janthinobacterium sp. SUN118]MDN2709700.1 hypothetical protein [Janthinobacterium sp. SUN118]
MLKVTGTRGVESTLPPWKPPSANWIATHQSSMWRARWCSASSPARCARAIMVGMM